MPKQAISVTLDEANLVWLRGVSERSGARSLSETLDRLITSARQSGSAETSAVRSVVGTIDLPADDPLLERADEVMRDLFARSLSRPFMAKEARATITPARKRRG
jgi:hypothetical protein